MQTKKENVKTKMIQIPVSLSVYDKVRKYAEAEKRTVPAQCKVWLAPYLKDK